MPGEGVFMVAVEGERLLEGAPGPREFFAGEIGVAHPDMELHGAG
jgi:hypothetical protein